MPCTTILVGKKASYDGSTMIARNDDAGAGKYMPKKFVVVQPEDQPRRYKSVLSHVEIDLPDNPLRYTAVPNAVEGEGTWAAAGFNAAQVSMTATETISSNPRVLGADPLVVYEKATEHTPEKPGGIGEEDIVVLVLPYIRSAREGVVRLGQLLETYGTYEANGIAFQDKDEIWWLESIGGHHWMARRVPDEAYVMMPNQLGIDAFDFEDALGEQEAYMCSADLQAFVEKYHLDLTMDAPAGVPGRQGWGCCGGAEEAGAENGAEARCGRCSPAFSPRDAFGSRDDADHVYNTPRAWFMGRYFNPNTYRWDGPEADYRPDSDDLPWCLVPEKKITVEDVKYIESAHFQGTPFDPYAKYGDPAMRGAYRSIGVNRTDFLSIHQLRPYAGRDFAAVTWVAFASNVFNTLVPLYANVDRVPAYLSCTTGQVTTDSFYWASRLIAALADGSFGHAQADIERYQEAVQSAAHAILNAYDAKQAAEPDLARRAALREEANEKLAAMLRKHTDDVLLKVLNARSNDMKNAYARSDN